MNGYGIKKTTKIETIQLPNNAYWYSIDNIPVWAELNSINCWDFSNYSWNYQINIDWNIILWFIDTKIDLNIEVPENNSIWIYRNDNWLSNYYCSAIYTEYKDTYEIIKDRTFPIFTMFFIIVLFLVLPIWLAIKTAINIDFNFINFKKWKSEN